LVGRLVRIIWIQCILQKTPQALVKLIHNPTSSLRLFLWESPLRLAKSTCSPTSSLRYFHEKIHNFYKKSTRSPTFQVHGNFATKTLSFHKINPPS
jgi:hypothetical protein